MFKILVTTKFRDRVVNYAQTVRELVGTMREDACQCVPVRAMPRIIHEQLTSSSRVVHDMFTNWCASQRGRAFPLTRSRVLHALMARAVPTSLRTSRTVCAWHEQFTTSSRAVHKQFTSSSRLLRDSGARVGAGVYIGLPGHCSPFQRSPAKRQLISQRQHA